MAVAEARGGPRGTGLIRALPFWLSLVFVPLVALCALYGGWFFALVPAYGFLVLSVLDRIGGLNETNLDPDTPDAALFWHRLITWIWLPIQLGMLATGLIAVTWFDHLSAAGQVGLMVVIGVVCGTVGINYAHELIHQKNRWERALGEWLLISVLYGHFRSEHLLVHHRYVGTPRDPVTARYNESFYRFFARVLLRCPVSAFEAERAMLARRGLPVWHRSNPFWRYGLGGLGFVAAAYAIGGWAGVGYYLILCFFAVLQLEVVNYIEHYGLTRRHLGAGKYEHVQPRHSWNAAHRFTNYLLINLQRHSDHHYKPDRRFPLLQNYDTKDAPQLPFGYPIMAAIAFIPPLWRRMMNPRVRAWRKRYYPDITDWAPYKAAATPMPR